MLLSDHLAYDSTNFSHKYREILHTNEREGEVRAVHTSDSSRTVSTFIVENRTGGQY